VILSPLLTRKVTRSDITVRAAEMGLIEGEEKNGDTFVRYSLKTPGIHPSTTYPHFFPIANGLSRTAFFVEYLTYHCQSHIFFVTV
jgi:hypothetical protein